MSLKAIEAATESWATAFNRGDAAGCGAHYHPEARLHGQPFPASEGRAAIEVFWQKLIEEGYTDVRYLDRQIELTPAGSAIVTSPWSMNRARGMITREEWQEDSAGKWLIMSDEFEILDNNPVPNLPRPVVLLHGAWMGAWCWGVTQEELGAAGVTAKAMDLPGHGKRSAESVGDSLTPYVDAAVETISACDAPWFSSVTASAASSSVRLPSAFPRKLTPWSISPPPSHRMAPLSWRLSDSSKVPAACRTWNSTKQRPS